MEIVGIDGFTVQGLAVRTCNKDEAQASSAGIGPLWQVFGRQIAPYLEPHGRIYGVYHHYESDADGCFNVLAGTDALLPTHEEAHKENEPALTSVSIAAGPYLVFEAHGVMPQAVIEAWGRIWRYFADPQCLYRRAYTTDFERYLADQRVDICIAVGPI